MNELWFCPEDGEFFDSEETARAAYTKYCEVNEIPIEEEVFELCYHPLSKWATIWTLDTIKNYRP